MHPITSTVRSVLLGAGAAALLCAGAHAQEFTHLNDSVRGAPSPDNHYIGTPKGWKQPMTPWGEPDIQAKLDMMQAAGVPLERCASSYGGGLRRGPSDPNQVHVWGRGPCKMDKQWLTEEEYNTRMEEYRKRVDRSNQLAAEGDLGGAIQAGLTDPNIPQRQTNLIVDPPNGLLPDLTPEGKRLALDTHSDWALPGQDLTFDGPQDFDSWDRCITRGMPSSMMPYRYNGGFFIKQTPGYVIFQLEMIHEARIIPTDGSPAPVSSNVRQWMGVSRGHWEGTTLVVETTNYHVGAPIINLAVVGSPPGNHFPYSEQMKTTERITRLNDDWWLYEITTEDPVVLTRPFTVRYPLRNDPSYLMPEYACHEGNTIIRNYTETSRYERAHPTPEPEQEPVKVDEGVADELAGEWVGTPRIVTIDDHIRLQFTKASANTVNGKLIGTNFGKIDKPLRNFKIDGKKVNFTLPNIDPWRFAGELTDEGTIKGIVASAQGGLPVTFRRTSSD
jgi:hypothetical protein